MSRVVEEPGTGPAPAHAANAAPLGPTVALTVVLGMAAFALVMALAALLVTPKPVPGLTGLTQRQGMESGLYVMALAIVLPAAVILAPRLANAIAAGANRAGLSLVAAIVAGTFAASIVIARLISDGAEGLLVTVGTWWLLTVALLTRVAEGKPWHVPLRSARLAPAAWASAGVLVLAALVGFASLHSISPVAAGAGAVAAGGVIVVVRRREVGMWAVGRGWGIAIDSGVIALLLAVVPNLDFLQADAAAGDQLAAFQRTVTQFHQNFYLGSVNEVLHGGAVLIDTASQYGVGPIYLLAGWFQLVPLSYGMLGLLDGVLVALLFAVAYGILRLAGVSRPLAATALAVAVVALVYNLLYPVGSLLQHGPVRFGLPMLVILAAGAEARWARRSRSAFAVQALAVGLSSVWALETFGFTLATFAGIALFGTLALPETGRWRRLARRASAVAAACVGAHLLFAAATLAAAGELPQWGQYVAYLHAFLFGELGEFTYDYSRWSAGLPVGVAYLVSGAALALLVRRRPPLLSSQRTALVVLAGTTVYGIMLYSYFVNRSADHIIPYVSLPAVMLAALWLSLLLRGVLTASPTLKLAGLVFTLSIAVLLVAVAWSSVPERFSSTPLAYGLPGGESLSAGFDRLADPVAIDPRAPHGERLLSEYLPGDSVPILVSPDLETEILLRGGRANALRLGYAREDSFVPSERLPGLERGLSELRPGARLLLEDKGLDAFAAYQADPSRDPFRQPASGGSLVPLQEWALRWLAERFDLRVLDRDEQGFAVVSLVPRPSEPETQAME